jgi:hypothetical protein
MEFSEDGMARIYYPYYRDPRVEDTAIGTLARFGRPPSGPTDEERLSAVGALTRARRPESEDALTDEEPKIVDDLRHPDAIAALARSKRAPDVVDEVVSDPLEEEAAADAKRSAALGGLVRAAPAPETTPDPEPVPDPGLLAEVRRNAVGGLVKSRPEPEPGPDLELKRSALAGATGALTRTGKALQPPPAPPPRKRAPVPFSGEKPLSYSEADPYGIGPDAMSEFASARGRETPAAQAAHPDDDGSGGDEGSDPLQGLLAENRAERAAGEGIGQDRPPSVNGWALAAALMSPGGRDVGAVIALADRQRQQWLKDRGEGLTPAEKARLEIEKGNLEARKAELEYRNRVLTGKQGGPSSVASVLNAKPLAPEDAAKPDVPSADEITEEVVAAGLGPPPDPSEMGEPIGGAPDVSGSDKGLTEAQRLARARFEWQKAEAKRKAEGGGEKPLTPAQKLAADKDAAAHGEMPGIVIDDKDAWKSATLTPAERGKVGKYASAARGALTALNDMIKLREAHGPEVLGPHKAAYDAAQLRAISGYTEIGHSGVLNSGEFARYKDIIPGMGPSFTDALDKTGKLIGRNVDTTLEDLKAVRAETLAAFNAGLYQAGARYDEKPSLTALKKQFDELKKSDTAVDSGDGSGAGGGLSTPEPTQPPAAAPSVGESGDVEPEYTTFSRGSEKQRVRSDAPSDEIDKLLNDNWLPEGQGLQTTAAVKKLPADAISNVESPPTLRKFLNKAGKPVSVLASDKQVKALLDRKWKLVEDEEESGPGKYTRRYGVTFEDN